MWKNSFKEEWQKTGWLAKGFFVTLAVLGIFAAVILKVSEEPEKPKPQITQNQPAKTQSDTKTRAKKKAELEAWRKQQEEEDRVYADQAVEDAKKFRAIFFKMIREQKLDFLFSDAFISRKGPDTIIIRTTPAWDRRQKVLRKNDVKTCHELWARIRPEKSHPLIWFVDINDDVVGKKKSFGGYWVSE